MKNISIKELSLLISQYVNRSRLLRENPISKINKDVCFFQNDKEQEIKGINELIIHTDGASRGNPGKAGIGVAIFDKDYNLIEEIDEFIGKSTNNIAEYEAMLRAAQKAIAYKAKKVTFKTDSELLVRQVNGSYRVRNQNILPLYKKLTQFLDEILLWKVLHVRREENSCADALANRGINKQS